MTTTAAPDEVRALFNKAQLALNDLTLLLPPSSPSKEALLKAGLSLIQAYQAYLKEQR